MSKHKMVQSRNAPSEARLRALMKWPKERICRRTLDIALTPTQHAKVMKAAEERFERMTQLPVPKKQWDSLERGTVTCEPSQVCVPDPRLLANEAHRIEYAGTMVCKMSVVVGGYRFTPDTTHSGVRMNVEKRDGSNVSSRRIHISENDTVKLIDGKKTVTIGCYGDCTSTLMAEGMYLKVE
ncbi:MAG: hypothetical protein GY852_09430 [bacterium]|nr:hypothetical protein [bacterium]